MNENFRGWNNEKGDRGYCELAAATREYVETVSVCISADAAPVPAMLCINEK